MRKKTKPPLFSSPKHLCPGEELGKGTLFSGKLFDYKNILSIFALHFGVHCALNCRIEP